MFEICSRLTHVSKIFYWDLLDHELIAIELIEWDIILINRVNNVTVIL